MSALPRTPAKRGRLHSIEGGASARSRPTDEELIQAVVRGDGAVAGELYDRLEHTVGHTLYRVLGRREPDHEDLVQSAFEQIVKTLTTRRFARACSLKTWAASVATNVGLNALRARRRERNVIDRGHDEGALDGRARDNPEHEVGARRELEEIRRALADLKPARAEAVFLHDVLGHDLAEIAALTSVTIAAAQSRLVRGRRDLVDRLEDLAKRGRR